MEFGEFDSYLDRQIEEHSKADLTKCPSCRAVFDAEECQSAENEMESICPECKAVLVFDRLAKANLKASDHE